MSKSIKYGINLTRGSLETTNMSSINLTTGSLSATNIISTSFTTGALSATDITFSGNLYQNGTIYSGGGGGSGGGVSSQWTTTSGNIYYATTAGNSFVGINTSTPTSALDVTGSARFTVGLTTGTILATGLISASNIRATNMSTGTVVATNVNATNATATNLVSTNMSTGTALATNVNATNATATNLVSTNMSTGTALATNVNATNATATNLVSTNMSTGTALATNVNATNATATNLVSTNMSSGTVVATNVNAGAVVAATSLYVTQGNQSLLFADYGTAGAWAIGALNNAMQYQVGAGAAGSHVFYTNSTTGQSNDAMGIERVRISGAGNMGVGVSEPTDKLHVAGNLRVNGLITVSNAVATNVSSGDLRTTNAYATLVSTSNLASANISTSTIIATGTSQTIGSIIVTDGNVGLGTVSPIHSLDIRNSVTEAAINLQSASTQFKIRAFTDSKTYVQSSGDILFTGIDQTGPRVTLLANGNVGIGTVSPGAGLHVNGPNAGDAMIVQNGANGFAAIHYLTDTTNWYGGVGGSASPNYGGKYYILGGNALLVGLTNGNWGINTDVPTNTLHVNGDLRVSGFITTGDLLATNATVSNLIATTATIPNLRATNITTGDLRTTNAYATLVSSANMTSLNATASNLVTTSVSTSNILSTGEASLSSITTGNINSSGDIRVKGNVFVTGNLTAVNITSLNLIENNISTATLIVSGTSNLQNVVLTNLSSNTVLSTTVTTTNLIATAVTSADLRTTNAYATLVSTANLAGANVTASNLVATAITSADLRVTNAYVSTLVSTANLAGANVTASNLVTTTATIPNVIHTNVTTGDLRTTNAYATLVSTANLGSANISTSTIIATGTNQTIGSIIVNSGLVGIGTVSPGIGFHVNASNTNDVMRVQNSSIGFAAIQYTTDATNWVGGVGGSAVANYPGKYYVVGGNAVLVGQTNGNWGFGTNSPTNTLHVNGDLRVSGFITTGTLLATNITANGLVSLRSTRGILIGTSTDIDAARFISALDSGIAANATRYISFGQGASTNNQAELGFQYVGTGNTQNSLNFGFFGGEKMRIQANGFVGIATNSPSEMLDVRGNLRIGGSTQSNYISFNGVSGDGYATTGRAYTYIGERVWGVSDQTELLLFKGDDASTTYGPDRIRLLAPEIRFDTSAGVSGTFDGIGTTGSTSMIITTSGNVGIGTTSPVFLLDLKSTSVEASINLQSTNTNFLMRAFNDTKTYIQSSGDVLFTAVGQTTPRVIFSTNGNVGIGAVSPAVKLDVYSTDTNVNSFRIFDIKRNLSNGANVGQLFGKNDGFRNGLWTWYNHIADGDLGNYVHYDWNGFVNALVLKADGTIGMGTATTDRGKLQISGGVSVLAPAYGWLGGNGNVGYVGANLVTASYSIYATERIACSEFNAFSDSRIKENVQEVDDLSALTTLRLIEPKKYNYIDKVTRGEKPVWGFIAQQVESVLDYSTGRIRDYIPNVYDLADVTTTNNVVTIKLKNKTTGGLVSADPVKIKLFVDDKGTEFIATLKDIIDEHTFTINETLDETPNVFVYGMEVSDFHTLNKDAIFTVNVAATQELDRELQTLKQKYNELEQKYNDIIALLQK